MESKTRIRIYVIMQDNRVVKAVNKQIEATNYCKEQTGALKYYYIETWLEYT